MCQILNAFYTANLHVWCFPAAFDCCRCLELELGPQCKDLPMLRSNCCPSWARSGVSVLRCTMCCRRVGLEVASQCSDARFVVGFLGSKWGPRAEMPDLLEVSWARSGVPVLICRCLGLEVVPALRCAICCRCLVGSHCEDVRFVAGVLHSNWGLSAKMYDLLSVSWARRGI